MSTVKTTDSPIKSPTESGRESPTTVRPLDMDDDEVPETPIKETPNTTKLAPGDANPPAKPPRPLTPQQQAELTLKEAFPTIDIAVIKAVLSASRGNIDPAFNALLEMTDPDAAKQEVPPAQPPRPAAGDRTGSTPLSQLEADEQYARQLASHYQGTGQYARSGSRGRPQQQQKPNEDERNFFDDDLPAIKENLKKGFLETQSTVNSWVQNLMKKIDGEEEGQSSHGRPQQGNYGPQGPGAQYGRRSGDMRRSGDYQRYDADPQVLGDDFAGIQLNDDGTQRRSTRPLANPDLFKPTPPVPRDDRKVAFQTNDNESDLYNSSPKPASAKPTAKNSKWQPLSSVDPHPMDDGDDANDNDPFSLGDSEDENPNKDRVGGKEVKSEDAERLKKKAAESDKEAPAKKLEPQEVEGTKNKDATDLTK